MNIGVIGTINRDTITFPDGSKRDGWGGIMYNLKMLSHLAGVGNSILPVCNVGYDCYRPVIRILSKLQGLNIDFIRKTTEKNNHCFLAYTNSEEKSEILKGGVRRLVYKDIKPLLGCDIILVNYISGRDIYLNSLKKLKNNFKHKIYIDIHSLTLGKRKNGSRYFRCPRNWFRVIEVGDYIQMNRRELLVLLGEKAFTETGRISLKKNLEGLFHILKRNRVDMSEKAVIITDGAVGCFLGFIKNDRFFFRPVLSRQRVIEGDTTGCGDCFSAGFIAGLITGKELVTCADLANQAGLRRIRKNRICSGYKN